MKKSKAIQHTKGRTLLTAVKRSGSSKGSHMREHSFDCLKKGCNSTKHQISGVTWQSANKPEQLCEIPNQGSE